jgi:hypothetical protein
MKYFSELRIDKEKIEIAHKKDPISDEDVINIKTSENELLTELANHVREIEKKTCGKIIIPTSGGYDSRVLNFLIKGKSRIASFTYGCSSDQTKNIEVVYAKKLSEILETFWQQIELKNSNRYIPQWHKLFGFSTHLHGMYHVEFYKKIFENFKFGKSATLLSGIFGDVWAGKVDYNMITKAEDLILLAYTHGLCIQKKHLASIPQNNSREKYFQENKEKLYDNKLKPVYTIRMKLMLISYLTQLPEYFGFAVWTPFLNMNLCVKTLNLPQSKRRNRLWQKEFFTKNNIDLENMKLHVQRSNILIYEHAKITEFEPIKIELFKNYIDTGYLKRINRKISKLSLTDSLKNKLLTLRIVKGICGILGIRNTYVEAVLDYYIIKSIEMSLLHEN